MRVPSALTDLCLLFNFFFGFLVFRRPWSAGGRSPCYVPPGPREGAPPGPSAHASQPPPDGGGGSPRASRPPATGTQAAYLTQGGGERTGSPVLQGQHPHSQPNQVRKRAPSRTPRGSAASAWGAGGMVEAAPPPRTRSPGRINRTGQRRGPLAFGSPPLGTGDREEAPAPPVELSPPDSPFPSLTEGECDRL